MLTHFTYRLVFEGRDRRSRNAESEAMAKQSTAMEACINKLRELKEFDNANLLPRSRLAPLVEVDQLDTSGGIKPKRSAAN